MLVDKIVSNISFLQCSKDINVLNELYAKVMFYHDKSHVLSSTKTCEFRISNWSIQNTG